LTKIGMNCLTCTDPIAGLDQSSPQWKACNY